MDDSKKSENEVPLTGTALEAQAVCGEAEAVVLEAAAVAREAGGLMPNDQTPKPETPPAPKA